MRYTVCFLIAAASLAVAGEASDPGWPREFSAEDGRRLLLYQPQIDSWEDYARIESNVAVGVYAAGAEVPVFGALRVTADTETSLDLRTVYVSNIEIEEMGFPSADDADVPEMERVVRDLFPDEPVSVSLDRLLAYAEQSHVAARSIEIASAPPRILWSQRPALLLLFDGDPAFERIEGTDLLAAINTGWDVFMQLGPARYFLRYDDAWLTARRLEGPWSLIRDLPPAFARLPDEEPWKEARRHLRGRALPAAEVPTVYLSTTPAELIVTDGAPRLTPIEGTRLFYVTNTDSDIFLDSFDGRYYYLVAGRWFRANLLLGPWTVVDALPDDFARIPADHPRAHVLASVPGSSDAKRAILLSQVPRTATVQRTVTVEVTYAGEPVFEPIPGTVLYYGVNTPYDVIRFRSYYYLCHRGIWFVAGRAMGPWVVCDSVPPAIYTIPAPVPLHHVTYVYVYGRSSTAVVFGYTGGYIGLYVWRGRVVFGTGYYHRHHHAWHRYVRRHRSRVVSLHGWRPTYHHRVFTYGHGSRYDPVRGTFVRGGRTYGPARGVRAAALARQRSNAYSRWASTQVARRDNGARVARTPRRKDAPVVRRTTVAKNRPDVYVGQDRRVYKRTATGWYRRDQKTWKPVKKAEPPKRVVPARKVDPPRRVPTVRRTPAPTRRKTPSRYEVQRRLERDAKARRTGAQRVERNKRHPVKPARKKPPTKKRRDRAD